MASLSVRTIFLLFLCWSYFHQFEAQSISNVSREVGNEITLSCDLTGTFILPSWRGPPNLMTYTNLGDPSINPAVSRLQYAINQKDLILSNAQTTDSGDYKCSYTALGDHTVTLTVTTAQNCKCECVCKWRYLVYVSIAFGILGALVLLIIVVGIQTGRFEKKKTLLLASDGIGVFCDVLSFVLNIAFQSKKSCEASENCEDSECCKEDSDCCKGSINIASIAFIVIPIVVGFISVVIFVLVKLDKIKLGRKDDKKSAPL